MMRKSLVVICCLTMFVLSTLALATETRVWTQSSYQEFSKGEMKDLSVSNKGEVTLARKLEKLAEIDESFVWDVATDQQGNVYVATGKEGRIYRIAPGAEKPEIFFDSPEINVPALEVDSEGNVYAGTAPDGLVFKITPEKVPTVLFSSGEKYVWDMALSQSGDLFVATGSNGKIFKISASGESQLVFDSEESNIQTLILVNDTVYAGSDKSGVIYSIDVPTGKVTVLYDSPEKEIRSLALSKEGALFAAATTGAPPQPSEGRQNQDNVKSAIYKVEMTGAARRIWVSPEPLILSIAVIGDGSLVVGTGDSGKVYSVTEDGQFTMVAQCEGSQVLRVVPIATETYLTTGNSGAVYKLLPTRAKEGELTSDVFDAGVVSTWGNLIWETILPAGTAISFATRSGNTEKPDNTWSDWSEEMTVADGSSITSPPARFIQWKTKLTTTDETATPVLRSVWTTCLQTNLAPNVLAISIDDEAKKSNQGQQTPPNVKTIQWKTQDANGDKLLYSVYIKGVDETNWRLLEEELDKPSYQFDSSVLPDGWYHIRVVATDLPSNPKAISLDGELISDPIMIDNSQPIISDIAIVPDGDDVVVTFTVSDQTSLIKSVSYSVDNDDWFVLFPTDKLFDSKSESLKIRLKGLEPGSHSISVRVLDRADNSASARKGFTK